MNKKTKFVFGSVLSLLCIGISATALVTSHKQNNYNFNQASAEEKVLVEDFSNPVFSAGVLHTEVDSVYVDLTCSDATLSGNSLVMAANSNAEAAVMGVTKLSVTFSGSLSVSIATDAGKYYVTEELSSATQYVFPFTANFLKLEASTKTTITRIEYSYVCEVAPTLLTNPTNTTLTTKAPGNMGAPIYTQCYNFWEENSGVHYNTTTKSTKLSTSFAVKANKNVYGSSDAFIGNAKEIRFDLVFRMFDGKNALGSLRFRIYKWYGTYVGARFMEEIGSTKKLIDYKTPDGALSTNIFKDIGAENGARFVLDFDGPKLAIYYNDNGTMAKLAETSLSHYNGNGNEHIRTIDYSMCMTGSEESPSSTTLSNFQIAYGFQGGSGKLVKA